MYAEDEADEDFSDILGDNENTLVKLESEEGSDRSTLMLNSKLSTNSWLGDIDDEDDPFAQLEEGLDELDLEANIARDKYARLRNQVEGLVSSLKTSQDDEVLVDISEQLVRHFCLLNFLFNSVLTRLLLDDYIFRYAGNKVCHHECSRNASYSRNFRHLQAPGCNFQLVENCQCCRLYNVFFTPIDVLLM